MLHLALIKQQERKEWNNQVQRQKIYELNSLLFEESAKDVSVLEGMLTSKTLRGKNEMREKAQPVMKDL